MYLEITKKIPSKNKTNLTQHTIHMHTNGKRKKKNKKPKKHQKTHTQGGRTLGVITKIDLMDQGTDAVDMLHGKIIPLNLGYVGVINRSQKAINDGLTIREALKHEESFFKNHPCYRNLWGNCLGTPFLATQLNQILVNHIKKCLPELRMTLTNKVSELQKELQEYGNPISEMENKGALILQLISKFCENFTQAIEGAGIQMNILMNQVPNAGSLSDSNLLGMGANVRNKNHGL